MRGTATRLAGQGNYRYDELGNLIVDEAETEEQRLAVEAAVLYKEGMSSNHPADIATHNAAAGEGGEGTPLELEGYEGETPEEEASRVEMNEKTRKAWAKRQRDEAQAQAPQEGEDAGEGEYEEETVEEPQPQEPEDDGRRGRRNRDRNR